LTWRRQGKWPIWLAAFGLPAGTGGVTLTEFLVGANNQLGVNGVPLLPTRADICRQVKALEQENYQYDTTSWSAFGQFDINFTDRLTLTIGGRYTEEDKEMETRININDPISALSFTSSGRQSAPA
jgi:iron complex outermembrane receptor protein